jgi:hypothetical protein
VYGNNIRNMLRISIYVTRMLYFSYCFTPKLPSPNASHPRHLAQALLKHSSTAQETIRETAKHGLG